jgi:aspartyl-tRNA(Asn)/glutamyl-tRNA(Gln) amidotransferase subunit B
MNVMIGLEIHVQLNTDSKLFCRCQTDYGRAEPNSNICPVCSGQPGGKPMAPNGNAIRNALRIAAMLGAKPELERPVFVQRKHYFYPDLPSGYQRTSRPLAKDGRFNGIGIWEVHFEEDPGRYELKEGFVDYNRSGIPLAEIVTAPDMRSPQDARDFLGKLEHYLRYFDAIKDEVGTMRVDSNVSIEGGPRVEVKNINSFSNVFDALSFEIKRQQTQVQQGMAVVQETRHFDENSGVTKRMRKKETADDYRYVPDPDVLPVFITKDEWLSVGKEVAELPDMRAERLVRQYRIGKDDASVLVIEKEFADAYESIAGQFDPQKFANWMRGPLRRKLNLSNLSFRKSGLTPKQLSELYGLFSSGSITDNAADQVLMKLIEALKQGRAATPTDIAKSSGLLKSADSSALKDACARAVKANEKAVQDYKAGNQKSLFFLVGKVMQETKGTFDAKEIAGMLKGIIIGST